MDIQLHYLFFWQENLEEKGIHSKKSGSKIIYQQLIIVAKIEFKNI